MRTLLEDCIRDEQSRHRRRLLELEKMRNQLRLLDADPAAFAWRTAHQELSPAEREPHGREVLHAKASQLSWHSATRSVAIAGFDSPSVMPMTELYNRMLSLGFKESSRDERMFRCLRATHEGQDPGFVSLSELQRKACDCPQQSLRL